MKLTEKVVIITGAAAGIGEASARLFAREGARLVLVDLDRAELEKLVRDLGQARAAVLDIAGDVSSPSVCRSVIERTMERFGRLDVLFNNAGIVPVGSLVDCTEEQWHRTIDVNIGSMYLLSREAVPLMVKQGGGCIINMGAVAGLTGVQNRGAYSVSKSAVIGLTKSLAADFIKDGLRVNCICPATVDTPSMRQRVADTPDPDATRRAFVARQPMGRLGTAEEIAALALYLASEDSRFMTGQAVVIDGGMMM
jgi:NAD(P)-dependent dehydrogenase (short-subunit alcohol dehydrogenase family)